MVCAFLSQHSGSIVWAYVACLNAFRGVITKARSYILNDASRFKDIMDIVKRIPAAHLNLH
jgi:hypothetical protein